MRVAVASLGNGIVRFVGETRFKPGSWVGIELEEADGRNDGSVQGVRYFQCPPARGVFVLPSAVQCIEGDGDRAGGACEVGHQHAADHDQPSATASGSTDPTAGDGTMVAACDNVQAFGLTRGGSRVKAVSSRLCDTSLPEGPPSLAASSSSNTLEATAELHDMYRADWCKPELFGTPGPADGPTTFALDSADTCSEPPIDVEEERRLLMSALDGMRLALEEVTQRAEVAEARQRSQSEDLQAHLKACISHEVREAVQNVVHEASSELRAAAAEIRRLRSEARDEKLRAALSDVAVSSVSTSMSRSTLSSAAAHRDNETSKPACSFETQPEMGIAATYDAMMAVKVAARQALENSGSFTSSALTSAWSSKDISSVQQSADETGSTSTAPVSAPTSAGCSSEGGSGGSSPKQEPASPERTSMVEPMEASVALRAPQDEPQKDEPASPRKPTASPSQPRPPPLTKLAVKPMAMPRVRAVGQPMGDMPVQPFANSELLDMQEAPSFSSPRRIEELDPGETRRVRDVVSEWERILPLRTSSAPSSAPSGSAPLAAWPFATAQQRGSSVLAPPFKPQWTKRAASLVSRPTLPTAHLVRGQSS